jgi:hypothetical protein
MKKYKRGIAWFAYSFSKTRGGKIIILFLLHKTTSFSPTIGENVELKSWGFFEKFERVLTLFIKKVCVSVFFQVRGPLIRRYIHHWILAIKTGGRRNAYLTGLTFGTFICLSFFTLVSFFVCFRLFLVNILGGIVFRASGFRPTIYLFARQTKHENVNPNFHFPLFLFFPRPPRKLGSQKVTMGKIIMGKY